MRPAIALVSAGLCFIVPPFALARIDSALGASPALHPSREPDERDEPDEPDELEGLQEPAHSTADSRHPPKTGPAAAGDGSLLLERYGPAASDASANPPQSERLRDAVARRAAITAMKRLHAEGFGRSATAEARARALDTIESISGVAELEAGRAILGGAGERIDLLATDSQVRAAFFRALAADASVGVPMLLDFAVAGDDPVRPQAIDALPREMPGAGEARIAEYLRGDRELFVNRAAMIAGSFGTAALIPSLVSAQFAPETPRRGDEAWIAIGKQTTYVRDLIPTVGDGSAAFQPVPGTVFEGSLLRIMESSVTIYRTEVHDALSSLVERVTGEPAPPFGYDIARWQAWESRELPRLLESRARLEREAAVDEETRTVPPARDLD